MKRLLPAFVCLLLTAAALLIGCDDVSPVLSGTPTPSASPTPLPDAFSAEITAEPEPTDALGKVLSGENHYYQYLSFGELRVYEYDTGTFLDGVCVNAYPQPLDGQIDIVYYDAASGKICGIGTLHNNVGTTRMETGNNAVYAEINTDISVVSMDFALEVKRSFAPVADAGDTADAQ